jgi:predicted RNA-binding Zn ribbon-like protein
VAKGDTSDPAQRIPTTAAAVVDLLNSRPHSAIHKFPDALQTPETASLLLRPFDQPATEAPSAERIAEIRALRTILLDIVSAPDGTGAAPGWTQLAEHASSITLRQDFSAPGKVRLQQVGGDPVVGGITLAVGQLITDGTWPRIRACANERCGRVFYDATRSRTQRWHSYETCGNRSNVAAYRARKKDRPAS